MFDQVLTNVGGDYYPLTGEFIFPSDGNYLFSVTVKSPPGYRAFGKIRIADEDVGIAIGDGREGNNGAGSITIIAHCKLGESVDVVGHYITSYLFGSSANYDICWLST